MLSLQSPAHAGSPLADFSTLKMEAIRSYETSVNARSTQRHIPKTTFFIVTAVKAWDRTSSKLFNWCYYRFKRLPRFFIRVGWKYNFSCVFQSVLLFSWNVWSVSWFYCSITSPPLYLCNLRNLNYIFFSFQNCLLWFLYWCTYFTERNSCNFITSWIILSFETTIILLSTHSKKKLWKV
jgi:hypothetical protein